jgi:hypothetical protein
MKRLQNQDVHYVNAPDSGSTNRGKHASLELRGPRSSIRRYEEQGRASLGALHIMLGFTCSHAKMSASRDHGCVVVLVAVTFAAMLACSLLRKRFAMFLVAIW